MGRTKKKLTPEEETKRKILHKNNMKRRYALKKRKENIRYLAFARDYLFKDLDVDLTNVDIEKHANSKVKAHIFDLLLDTFEFSEDIDEIVELKKNTDVDACD